MRREMYMVISEDYSSVPFDTLELAEELYEKWKDEMMAEGVQADETFIEIVASSDGWDDDYRVIKKVVAVIDNDRTELGSPREEGCDWDYWAKWQEVEEVA